MPASSFLLKKWSTTNLCNAIQLVAIKTRRVRNLEHWIDLEWWTVVNFAKDKEVLSKGKGPWFNSFNKPKKGLNISSKHNGEPLRCLVTQGVLEIGRGSRFNSLLMKLTIIWTSIIWTKHRSRMENHIFFSTSVSSILLY